MTRTEAVAELQALWGILNSDLDDAVAYGKHGDTPYARRALVRAHFALVEGMSYALRQVTLASLRGTPLLTDDEVLLLREERPTIDQQGEVIVLQQYLKFPDSLLFSLRCYVKNHGASFEPDRTHPGWAALKAAVKVRDKITHPKSASAVELSQTDLKLFVEGAQWWKMTMLAMFAACNEADEYWKAELKKQHDVAG